MTKGLRAMEKRFTVYDYTKPKNGNSRGALPSLDSKISDAKDAIHEQAAVEDVMEGRDHEINLVEPASQNSDEQETSPIRESAVQMNETSSALPDKQDPIGKTADDESDIVLRPLGKAALNKSIDGFSSKSNTRLVRSRTDLNNTANDM